MHGNGAEKQSLSRIYSYRGYSGRLVDPEAGLACYIVEPVDGPFGIWQGAIACASPAQAETRFSEAIDGRLRVDRYRRNRHRGPRPFKWLNLAEWAAELGIGRDVVSSLRREEFADRAGVRAISMTLNLDPRRSQRPCRVTRPLWPSSLRVSKTRISSTPFCRMSGCPPSYARDGSMTDAG